MSLRSTSPTSARPVAAGEAGDLQEALEWPDRCSSLQGACAPLRMARRTGGLRSSREAVALLVLSEWVLLHGTVAMPADSWGATGEE
jgi:hypothetical protein